MTIKHMLLNGCVLAVSLSACATQTPRWTPENVAPPAHSESAFEQAPPMASRVETPKYEPGAPIRLTRDGAILEALSRNRAIEVARWGPRIGDTYVPEARAAFDPVLLGSVSTGHDTQQIATTSGSSALSNIQTVSNGSSSAAATATTAATPINRTIQLVNQIQQLASTIGQPDHPFVKTDSTQGSLTVQEFLPTGTQVFLTGSTTAADTNASTSDDYQGAWTLEVNQALLQGAGTGVNLIALHQAQNQAVQSRYAFRGAVLDIVNQVELAYWNLVLANEVLKIREAAVRLADEQLKRNEDLLSVGKAIEGDVMAAKAEKATRSADLTDAQAAVRAQTIALVRLLNPDVTQPWQLAFETVDPAEVLQVAVNPDESERLALQYRTELAQARLSLANLDLNVAKAKNDLLPKLDLVGSYGLTSRGTSAGGATEFLGQSDFENYRIGIEFNTAFVKRAERARYHRAAFTQSQAEKSIANLEQSLAAEIRQAVVEVDRQWQRIEATREAVQSRIEQFRVAEGRYEVGKTTNLDMLIVQRDLIQAQVDEATARVKYIQALTSLYAAEGALLERRGITLDTNDETK